MWGIILWAVFIGLIIWSQLSGKKSEAREAAEQKRRRQESAALRNAILADRERHYQTERAGYPPLDSEASALKDELIKVGLCDDADKYDLRGRPQRSSWFLSKAHKRAREIGTCLNKKGGNELMLQVHNEVQHALGGSSGRELEMAWDGIGEWQG